MPDTPEWRYIGKPIKRKEDLRVLLGKTEYVGDVVLPGMVDLGFYRSPYARARIKSLGLAADAGVLAFLGGRDVKKASNPMPLISAPEGCKRPEVYPLAVDEVRYAGEPVAAVVVGDRHSVEDAVEKVEADFEPLPPVVDLEEAMKSDARVFEDWDSNVAYTQKLQHGEVAKAFDGAHTVVSGKFEIRRQYGAAMEPRGAIAEYDAGKDLLTLVSSTQWPHFVAKLLSETLNHPESKIRVVAPDVGGGFGNKQDFYREEVVVAHVAKTLGRPVRWIPDRREDMSSTVHSRAQVHSAELALTKEGRVLGLRASILADLGAYGPMSLGAPTITFLSMTGPYEIDNLSLEMKCVVTNSVPTGAYRGFGQPEASFVIERLMDMAADELKVDKAEIRRRNLVRTFPYRTATGRVIDSGDYVRMLDRGLELSGYASLRSSRPKNDGRVTGIGLAFGLEAAGIGPSKVQDSLGARHKGYDSILLRIGPDGRVTILTGLSPHGQGLETTLAQVCADTLGVEMDDIAVVRGDSRMAPFGYGTWGSRSAVLGAGALLKCVEELKAKMVEIAAYNFQRKKEELEFVSGVVSLKASGEKVCSIGEVAEMAADPGRLPPGTQPGLEATAYYEPPGLTITGGFHVAVVEVDPDTADVRVVKYVMVHDCGIMLNPLVVEGQLQGGLAQGVGGALLEEVVYGEEGQLQTSTFMDYLIPTSLDVPDFELAHTVTPTPNNSLGIKGMGESGIIGPAPAINNAVCDALMGKITLNRTPLSYSGLWTSINAVRRSEGSLA